jgi:hypothetical protein
MAWWILRRGSAGGSALVMLDEVALTPDIFDGALYSSQDACDIHLRYIREPLLHEVLIRNLRNGDWSAYVGAAVGRWHPKGKELFKKLATQDVTGFGPSAGVQSDVQKLVT